MDRTLQKIKLIPLRTTALQYFQMHHTVFHLVLYILLFVFIYANYVKGLFQTDINLYSYKTEEYLFINPV